MPHIEHNHLGLQHLRENSDPRAVEKGHDFSRADLLREIGTGFSP